MAGDMSQFQWQKALVVYVDQHQLWYLRWLKRGFRHCFVVLQEGDLWLAVDPLSNGVEITPLWLGREYDLAGFYQDCGYVVQHVLVGQPRPTPAPLSPFSCVEMVKRVLGIQARWVNTPFQLYVHVNKSGTLLLTGVEG